MSIKDAAPFDYVSRNTFQEDEGDRLALDEIDPGYQYVARFILNPLCEKDFAGDYYVLVEGITYPEPKRLRLPMKDLARVSLTLIDEAQNLEPTETAPEHWAISEDGMLVPSKARLRLLGARAGYLLDAFDELDEEWEALQQNPVRSPALELVGKH